MSPRTANPSLPRTLARLALALALGLGALLVAVSPGASDAGEGAVTPATRLQRLASLGMQHSCAITDTGAVECWGDNSHGQLGTGDNASGNTPRLVSGVSGAVQVASGNAHTCALIHGGAVRCWGLNASGQLGNGFVESSNVPVTVQQLGGDATRLVAGDFHTCALLEGGAVKCWGQDGMGQLGDGDPGDFTGVPVGVQGLPAGDDVVDLAAGEWHTCARTTEKDLWCWGHNGFRQLGDGTDTDRAVATQVLDPDNLSDQPGPELAGVLAVSAGSGHTCAILEASTRMTVCWGHNAYGQLGFATTVSDGVMQPSTKPGRVQKDSNSAQEAETDVAFTEDARSVSAGAFHTCATVDDDGQVWCWGQNDHAQLGYDFRTPPLFPKDRLESSRWAREVPGITGRAVVAGGFHTCVLQGPGMKCWGYDFYGQLGGYRAQVPTPTVVTAIQGARKVAVGTSFACALLTDGLSDPDTAATPYCWGDNANGRLGTSDIPVGGMTTVRQLVSGGSPSSDLRAGNGTACVLPDAGTRRCWGLNASGELGDTTLADQPTPVASTLLDGATAYDLGGTLVGTERGTTCRITGGQVKCWGYNGQGQLGDGTTTSSIAPVSPVTVLYDPENTDDVDPTPITGATAVAVGGDHACAIVGGGQVRCWGANGSGQLGDNTTTARQYAVRVQEDDDADPDAVDLLEGATALVAGDSHTCALLSTGKVRCWGLGSSGQLGRSGAGQHANLPVRWLSPPASPADLDHVTRLVSGDDHTCAIRATAPLKESLVCWGENDENQLGVGSGDSNIGLLVLEAPDLDADEEAGLGGQAWIQDVSAGRLNTCVVLLDRTVSCWGDNTRGQVGDGLGTHSLAPVDVGGAQTFGVNQIPLPPDLTITTSPGNPGSVPVPEAGVDPDGGPVVVTAVGDPPLGSAAFTSSPGAVITYTPDPGSGCHDDTFDYYVSDGQATVAGTVTVLMNCAPVAVADVATVAEDGSVLVDVLANDTDEDGDALTLDSVSDPGSGTATIESGQVRYAPDADVCSPPADAFSYEISDGHGHTVVGVVTVTITCGADGPAVGNDAVSTPEETEVVIDVLANDDDVDGDALTIKSVSNPDHGTATTNGSTVRYVPDADYCGPDTFTYVAGDGALTATGTVNVSVTCQGDSPRPHGDQASTPEDTSVLIDVLANDTDPDPADTLSLTGTLGAPEHGTAAVESGKVRYSPDADYCGPDTFTYEVTDGTLSAMAEVSVQVTCVNDAPVAVDDAASTQEDTAVHVHVTSNDLDVDGDNLTITGITDPAHGTATGAINNAVAYAPDANYCGSDSFGYDVVDPSGATSHATVAVEVVCVDDPVQFAPIPDKTTRWGDLLSVPLSASDLDGEPIVFTVLSPTGPSAPTVDVSTLAWTPTAAQVGLQTVTVRASSGGVDVQRSFKVTVQKRETTLTYTGATSGQVSDAATVAAVLSDTATGFPVAGRPVTFTLGPAAVTGPTTAPLGEATGSLQATSPLGARTLSVAFAGDPAYLPTSATAGFAVTKEDATVALAGSPHVTTSSGSAGSATMTYVADLAEQDDGTYANALAGTSVAFKRLDGTTICSATASNTAPGRARATCSASQPVGAQAVVVVATPSAYAMRADVGVTTVANPGSGFASGAGRIQGDDFGFQARPVRRSAPTGNLVHVVLSGSTATVVHASSLGSLTTSCTKAKVCGVHVVATAGSYTVVDLVTGTAAAPVSSSSAVTVDAVDPNRYAVAISGAVGKTIGPASTPPLVDFGAIRVTP